MVRALIVDDSAVAREVLSHALRRDPEFDVVTAPNAAIAAERIRQHVPDVIVLDIELPGMNGLAFLERLMTSTPLPVVVCSSIAQPGAMTAVRALELGAVEVVAKPSLSANLTFMSGGRHFHEIVREAAAARVRRQHAPAVTPVRAVRTGIVGAANLAWKGPVIVIGASTGGTEAIRMVLASLPDDAPPVVIVQHMPAAFTGAFANRMNSLSPMQVREARDGDALRQGVALIAPGGVQLEIVRHSSGDIVRVFAGEPVSGHRPSVDVLFRSAAKVIGARAVGVLLTGMGADGADGLLRLRAQGAHTIAQDEATCVVYGMPREAVTRGAAKDILPVERIGRAALDAAEKTVNARRK